MPQRTFPFRMYSLLPREQSKMIKIFLSFFLPNIFTTIYTDVLGDHNKIEINYNAVSQENHSCC